MIWLRIVCLSIHLFLMNLASAGPLFSVWLDTKGTRNASESQGRLGRRVGWLSLAALGLGIVVGVVQGVVIWATSNRHYFQAVDLLWESKIVYGFWELAFSAACVAGYLLWWRWGKREALWQRLVSRFLGVLAATNLLYHFPTLFTILGQLARGEIEADGPINSAEFRTLLLQGEVIWFTVHFWMASLAVGGVVVGVLSLWRLPPEEADGPAKGAFMTAMVATLLQIPIGFFFTTSLNSSQQSRLMGQDLLSTSVFLVSLVLALWLMHVLAGLAIFERTRTKAFQALGLLVSTILLMTATMLLSRQGL